MVTGPQQRKIRKNIHIFSTAMFLLGQLLLPFVGTNTPVYAQSGTIDVSKHQGELSPSGSGDYIGGNITTYREGESINFRFTIDASAAGSGTMQVEFTERDNDCLFFTDDFELVEIENISGVSPTIEAEADVYHDGTQISSGRDWIQELDVNFTGDGEAVVHYRLTLSNEAGDCSGSSQHSRLANGPNGHQSDDFGNIGQENVPVPANEILILPSIEISKLFSSGDANPNDFSFTVSPSIDEQNQFFIEEGDDSVLIDNVNPDFDYLITEHTELKGYVFENGSGLNCSTVESSIGTVNGQMLVSGLEAGRPNPISATCSFTNEEQSGSITIEKETLPAGSSQEFEFSTDAQDNNFSLEDGESETLSLEPGDYSFTELDTDGWELTDLTCSTDEGIEINGTTVDITLGAGEDITCTYTNTELATIIVEKVTEPDEATGEFTFTGHVEGTIEMPEENQLSTSVLPGSYTSTETSQDLWKLKDIVCDDTESDTPSVGDTSNATATFNVEAGDVVTCYFTNMQFGSIEVLKNLDTNGDGQIDTENADWQWTLDGGDSIDTGTTKDVLPNETYTVAEIMEDDYHFTSLACEDDTGAVNVENAESFDITIEPGQHVICTFTNTRDTAYITIEKALNPTDDSGVFDLLFDGSVEHEDASHGDKTSKIRVLTNTDYTVSEEAGEGTTLSDYASSYVCEDDQTEITSGEGVSVDISLNKDQDVVCTFTNIRLAELTVEKMTLPDESEQEFDFDINGPDEFSESLTLDTNPESELENSSTLTQLALGDYTIEELTQDGWKLTGLSCSDESEQDHSNYTAAVSLEAGDQITCTFTNTQLFDLTITKVTDPEIADQDFDFTLEGGNGPLSRTLNTSGEASYTFEDLTPDEYTVLEELVDGWQFNEDGSTCSLDDTQITYRTDDLDKETYAGFILDVPAGTTAVDCTFSNIQLTDITIQKIVNPSDSEQKYDFISTNENWEIDESLGHNDTIERPGLLPDTYSLEELLGEDPQYATYITCDATGESFSEDDYTVEGAHLSIDAAAGHGAITCTFSNVEHSTIIVEKETLPAGTEEDFPVEITTENENSTVFSESTDLLNSDGDTAIFIVDGDGDFSYSIDETNMPEGWDQTANDCQIDDIAPGETVECTITNTQRGTVTIEKETINIDENEADPSFTFSSETTSLDNQEGITGAAGDNSYTSDLLEPDTYAVSEDSMDDWTLTDLTCDDESEQTTDDRTAQIALLAGENITCTFTNTRDAGLLTLIKTVNNDHGGGADEDDFTPLINDSQSVQGESVEWNKALELATDTYDVTEDTENMPHGYRHVDTACYETGDESEEVDNPIELERESDITCKITNEDIAPQLTLNKIVVDNYGGDAEPEDWELFATPEDGSEAVELEYKDEFESQDAYATTYTLSESEGPDGYTAGDWECRGEGASLEGDQLTLELAADATCDITNTAIAPTLTLIKQVENDFDPDHASAEDWLLEAVPESEAAAELSGAGGFADQEAYATTYTLSESSGPEGYSPSAWVCDDEDLEGNQLTLSLDEHMTCVITNTRDIGTIEIEKELDLDTIENLENINESFEFTSDDGGLNGSVTFENGEVVSEPLSMTVPTGTYSSTEIIPDGWNLTDISCDAGASESSGSAEDETATFNLVNDGDEITCTFTNALIEPTLIIEKDVNTPVAEIGDFVTYTLTVTNDSDGILYDTVVTDVTPEGFIYQSATWSATSDQRSTKDMNQIVGVDGPTYASPGDWSIGTLMPGEVVTLSYAARVDDDVDPGDYPDLAYAVGSSQDQTDVFSNIHNVDEPFVSAQVAIDEDPEVVSNFSAETVTTITTLPQTGGVFIWIPAILAALGTLIFENRRYRRKGALV